jgi:NADH:ubiquinone oxidoreductase subunit C
VSKILFQQLGLRFAIATGTDTPKGLEILYHFSFDKSGEMVSIRVLITDKTHPEIESISSVIKMAEWIEREMWEMLGIKFKNHPNLKRLLLADSWPEGVYPMRQGT